MPIRRPFPIHAMHALVLALGIGFASAAPIAASTHNGLFEATFESKKAYRDPFNDVDVDVIFSGNGRTWRVPTFWRGGNVWGVRFAPPSPGEYSYRLESTDKDNAALNRPGDRINITAYAGDNRLLKHGPLKVSANKRYLEHADGTPFYWLGETLYTAMSERIGWEGFQKLISDRKAKGFTVAQVNVGLTVSNEEVAPIDAGFRNEGGPVWDAQYRQLNPRYYDYADRRVQYLIDSGIMPAIFGPWSREIGTMGMVKVQKYWRNLIARYGAYPVIWVLAGEVNDPPLDRLPAGAKPSPQAGQWTQIARYIHAQDPYGRLLTAHEASFTQQVTLQEDTLTDFDLMQPSHFSWASIATEIAQLNIRWSNRSITKPLVVGEIGLEGIGSVHLQDFQRMAFWMAMLNGAAGFTYGTAETAMGTSADTPLHPIRYSFYTWEEAMNFPGSSQVGLNAGLLKPYPWWRMEPHPEWVKPRGTTLLEPHEGRHDVDLGRMDGISMDPAKTQLPFPELDYPKGTWKQQGGNFLLPYAAGIPRELRVIYIPYHGVLSSMTQPPTVLGLEEGVRYHAYYWEPSLGIKFDLGAVEKPALGKLIRRDRFDRSSAAAWLATAAPSARFGGKLTVSGRSLLLLKDIKEADFVAAVDVRADTDAALLLRYQDEDNYLAAVYSASEKAIYLAERKDGKDGPARPRTAVVTTSAAIRLIAEVRDDVAAAAVLDGVQTYSTAIETVGPSDRAATGLLHQAADTMQTFANFELRESPTLVKDEHLERKLYDARGIYRGEMVGPAFPGSPPGVPFGWDEYGKRKRILLGAYRPERFPVAGDWVLVLENRAALNNGR